MKGNELLMLAPAFCAAFGIALEADASNRGDFSPIKHSHTYRCIARHESASNRFFSTTGFSA